MRSIFKFLVIVLCCINFTSCSNDDNVGTDEPVVVVPPPVPPKNVVLKPAIVNIANSNSTGKSKTSKGLAVTKRLVKTITFTSSTAFDYKYKTNLSLDAYKALPNDNLYDPTEEILNVDTKRFDERTYTYNASGNLAQITINNIAYPGNNNNTLAYSPILFNYLESGARVEITKYQDKGAVLEYEYNTIGQVIKARDLYGVLKYTFEYDENNNISSKYYYTTDASGTPRPQYHYTYFYYSNSTYTKNWIGVDANGVEKLNASITYTYNKNLSGVYNNEPIYKILMDNEEGLAYLHVISNTNGSNPKYFYDADGYLIKYDKHGLNDANDITLFIYE
jgi:hypothetical protein